MQAPRYRAEQHNKELEVQQLAENCLPLVALGAGPPPSNKSNCSLQVTKRFSPSCHHEATNAPSSTRKNGPEKQTYTKASTNKSRKHTQSYRSNKQADKKSITQIEQTNQQTKTQDRYTAREQTPKPHTPSRETLVERQEPSNPLHLSVRTPLACSRHIVAYDRGELDVQVSRKPVVRLDLVKQLLGCRASQGVILHLLSVCFPLFFIVQGGIVDIFRRWRGRGLRLKRINPIAR